MSTKKEMKIGSGTMVHYFFVASLSSIDVVSATHFLLIFCVVLAEIEEETFDHPEYCKSIIRKSCLFTRVILV